MPQFSHMKCKNSNESIYFNKVDCKFIHTEYLEQCQLQKVLAIPMIPAPECMNWAQAELCKKFRKENTN